METPKRGDSCQKSGGSRRNLAYSPNITPIQVSPGRSPTQGNLTGSARKVKDGVVDWHNYIQKWDDCNTRGLSLIREISNVTILANAAKTEDEENLENVSLTSRIEKLNNLCQQLMLILHSMHRILEKFRALNMMFKNVGDLELHQNQGEWDSDPLFQTWPTWKFGETSEDLLSMYEKEYDLKKAIVENVAHSTNRDLSMVYSVAWLHQPYVDKNKDSLLQSMLLECRLK